MLNVVWHVATVVLVERLSKMFRFAAYKVIPFAVTNISICGEDSQMQIEGCSRTRGRPGKVLMANEQYPSLSMVNKQLSHN